MEIIMLNNQQILLLNAHSQLLLHFLTLTQKFKVMIFIFSNIHIFSVKMISCTSWCDNIRLQQLLVIQDIAPDGKFFFIRWEFTKTIAQQVIFPYFCTPLEIAMTLYWRINMSKVLKRDENLLKWARQILQCLIT